MMCDVIYPMIRNAPGCALSIQTPHMAKKNAPALTAVNAGSFFLWLIGIAHIRGERMVADLVFSTREDREVLLDWIDTLCVELELDGPAQAFLVLKETLHAIRDFLPLGQAVLLAETLPFIIRCIYLSEWIPGVAEPAFGSSCTFIDRIDQRPGTARFLTPEEAAVAVFALSRRQLSGDEHDDPDILSFRSCLRPKFDA